MKKKRKNGAEEPLENGELEYLDTDRYYDDGLYYEEENGGYDEAYEEYDGATDEYYDDEYYDDEDYEDDEYYEDDEESPQNRTLRRTAIYMAAVLVASVILAVVGWFAADDVLALTKPDNVITITIGQDDDLGDVARNLKDHGLIRYKLLFLLYGKFSHAEEDIHAGTFELNQQFDYHALVNGLSDTSETRMTVTLTFPEGYSCDQIFSMLDANGVCSLEELEDTAANYEFDYEFLADRPYGEKNRLEGYLFPDTYEFYMDDDPERVINRLLGNFEDKFSEDMITAIEDRNADIRSRMEEEGTFSEEEIQGAMMDMYKIVTLASLIEKEAGSESERSLIASVIYNRLTTHVHELLQIDATVEYALGEHEGALTEADLEVDSPYNTYRNKGLPPGPIANPGLASIMAALYPKDTDFFFYALSEDGDHEFFETYMEQQDFLMGIETETPEPQPEPQPEPEPEPEEQQDEEEGFEQVPDDGEEPENGE